MNTEIKDNNKDIKSQIDYFNSTLEVVPNQHSFSHTIVRKRVPSTLINKEKGNMPQEFGKLRPIKTTHSPTMTP